MPSKFPTYISYIFHPINFPILGALIYFIFLPRHIFKAQEYSILAVIFIGAYAFPLLFMYIMKRNNMIRNFEMESIEERKFPSLLVIAIAFIIGNWLYKLQIVNLLALFFIAYGITMCLVYLFLFAKIKVSLHMLSVSGLLGFLMYFSFTYAINLLFIFIALSILIGIIGTARLKLNAHSLKEVTLGFLLGIMVQLAAFVIYMM